MARTGKFIYTKFFNKVVEFAIDIGGEWIEYSDHTAMNEAVLSGVVVGYDEDSGVIMFESVEKHQKFYIPEESISVFWESGCFNLIKNTNTLLGTGSKFVKKNRDIM